jgi:hypothetical protein
MSGHTITPQQGMIDDAGADEVYLAPQEAATL